MFQIVTDSCCDIPFQFLDEEDRIFTNAGRDQRQRISR